MSDERLEAGEPCMVSISAGLRPIHKKAVVTSVKPKGYDVLCEGETTERHVSEKKAKRLPGRKATASLEIPAPRGARQESAGSQWNNLTFAEAEDPDELLRRLKAASTKDFVLEMELQAQPKKTSGITPLFSVEAVARSTKPQPKPRPRWRSAEYLKFVGEHDCCGCGKHGPSDAHHWGGSKGMSLKVHDALTVPLCNGCHIEGWHRTGKLPGMTQAETHLRFRETQVALLVEWILIKFQEVDE